MDGSQSIHEYTWLNVSVIGRAPGNRTYAVSFGWMSCGEDVKPEADSTRRSGVDGSNQARTGASDATEASCGITDTATLSLWPWPPSTTPRNGLTSP